MESFSSYHQNQSWLSWFLRGVLILGAILLLGRTFELSIIKSKYYRDLSEGNRIRKINLPAPRGRIIARGGEILVGNSEIQKKLIFNSQTGFEKIDEVKDALPEEIVKEYERYYNLAEKAAHLTGYLGEVNEKEVNKVNPECPEKGPRKSGELIGRSGLEQNYDCLLRGMDGEELIEVDTMGRKIRILGKKEPIPGNDLKTNISYDLQEKLGEMMGDVKGGIVVSDSQNQILALYSSPSFNPNYFTGTHANKDKVQEIFKDQNLPLFNRVIGGQYHPGSVFKPLIATAALEEGVIDASYIFDDQGQIEVKTQYGDFVYNNWYFTQYGGKEGKIDLVRAMARSTDTFFYKIGELTGIEKLDYWAEKFNFNKETGIDLSGEIGGLVPTPEWKKKVKNESWFLGNTYHFSIGQGDLAVTPIEINEYIAAISNNGKICTPQIIKNEKNKCSNLKIKKENLDLIKKGMTAVCTSGGTGYTFFGFDPQVACKTGTAETNEDGKTHAWFVFFAPNDFPEIVTTVLVEGGGEGSKVAGPIAREIANFWFKK